jgi:hypothetical protein
MVGLSMMHPRSWTRETWFYVALSAFVFMLVVRKAYVMPITHDEVSTINIAQNSVYDILTYADPIPNNHILNTLLLKFSIAILGDHPFTDRLPNVLFFIVYAFCTVRMAFMLFEETWVRSTFVMLFLLAMFPIDFFSVTRGYGMALALQVCSMYYALKFLKGRESRDLLYAIGIAAVGVVASFSTLNYYLPLLGIALIFIWAVDRRDDSIKLSLQLCGVTVILAAICFLPFKKMMSTDQFSFWGTSGFITDTYKPMVVSMRYATEYFGVTHEDIILWVSISLGILLLMLLLGLRKIEHKIPLFFILILFISMVIYNLLQFYVMKVPFLNPRTALCFMPIVFALMASGVYGLYRLSRPAGLILSIVMMGLLTQHFVRGYNVKNTFEWFYDANTYDVLRDLDQYVRDNHITTPIKVNCHWTYHPSVSYHIRQKYKDKFILKPYHKETEPGADDLFYFIEAGELEAMLPRYDIYREYNWRARFLMKKK